MMLNGTKAQMGAAAFAIFFVIASGYILWQFTPTIDSVRVTQLAATDPSNVLGTMFLYLLIPLLWCGWLVISGLLVLGTARG